MRKPFRPTMSPRGALHGGIMDVDRCFFCCLYGNNEQESIIRDMQRDLAYEDEMIFLEQKILGKSCAYQNAAALHRRWRPRDESAAPVHWPPAVLTCPWTAKLMRFLQLQEQKRRRSRQKEIEEELKRLKAAILPKWGKAAKPSANRMG